MRGNRRYFDSTTVTLTFPLLEIRKRVYLEISLGKCPTIESDKRPTVIETGNRQESTPQSHSPNAAVCGYLPEQGATSLGTEEYNEVVLLVGNIVDPDRNSSSHRKRGNYNHYSPEMRAKIGKYASENGNLRAINHFKAQLPNRTESTVRTFKQAYQKKLKETKSQGGIQESVTSIPHGTRGRLPILLDLDQKLISLLKSIRNRGGVASFTVVKASALAFEREIPRKTSGDLSQP